MKTGTLFRSCRLPILGSVVLLLAGSIAAVAGDPAPAAGGAAPAARRALTAAEQAAAKLTLDQIEALSGTPLQAEVRRLAKQFSDQGFDLSAVFSAVKSTAGNKLGAINRALGAACRDAPAGSNEATAVCAAAAALPDGTQATIVCPPGTIAVEDAKATNRLICEPLGAAPLALEPALPTAPQLSGGGGGVGTGGGTGTGNGTSGAVNGGVQDLSTFTYSGRSGSGTVGSSVSPR